MGFDILAEVEEAIDADALVRIAHLPHLRVIEVKVNRLNEEDGQIRSPQLVPHVVNQAKGPHLIEEIAEHDEVRAFMLDALDRLVQRFAQ